MKTKITLLTAWFLITGASVVAQFKLYEKGHDSYKAGKYEEAARLLSEYLTKGTRDKAIDIEVFYIRALSYYKMSQYVKAIPDFEETILLNHHNKGNIYWFLAKSHAGLGSKADAIEYYNGAIRELPNTSEENKAKLLFERSQLYSSLGQILLAYEDVSKARSIQPHNSDISKEASRLEKDPVVMAKYNSTQQPEQKVEVASNDKKSKSNTSKKKAPAKDTSAPPVTLANNTTTTPANTVTTPVTTASNPVGVPATSASNPVTKPVEQPVANTPTPVTTVPTLADQYKDEKRFALVIGNATYPKKIGELRNPVNDATDIAKELEASNFQVQLLTNATYGQIRAALLKFKDRIDGGEKDKTVALFYYAGHGLSFEDENYLVPVDAEVEFQDDIPRYCFPIQRMVLQNMERSISRMNIVILDACRNNPFPVATRSAGQNGLGEMKRARGSFIAYATSPGSVANDGSGRNGLYTQELLKSLKRPGLTIEQVFKDVRLNVLKLSNDKQNTWDSSNITGEFYFKF